MNYGQKPIMVTLFQTRYSRCCKKGYNIAAKYPWPNTRRIVTNSSIWSVFMFPHVTGLFLFNENTVGPAIDQLGLLLTEASRD